jgi:hypothetical protein
MPPSLPPWLALALLLAAAGCVKAPGAFLPDGFHDEGLPIAVRYTSPGARDFLGPDWRVDNFIVRDDGSIGAPKSTPEYVMDREVDVDGDGKPETESGFVYELKLANRVTTASIWVQTVTLSMQDKDRSLESFLDDFVEGLSGTGIYRVSVRIPKKVGATKTYGARVVDSKAGKTGGFDSLDATIELVNLDQLKVDPNTKSSIGRVVFVRTDYPHQFKIGGRHDNNETRVMTVIGCESNPRDFEAANADFARFLGNVELGQASH